MNDECIEANQERDLEALLEMQHVHDLLFHLFDPQYALLLRLKMRRKFMDTPWRAEGKNHNNRTDQFWRREVLIDRS
jgi:hypothetical protein